MRRSLFPRVTWRSDSLFAESIFCGARVGGEAAFEFFGDGDGFKSLAADGDEDEVGGGDQFVAAVTAHLEVEPQRFGADAADVDADLQQVVELRGPVEVAFEMRAREPHVKLVEHHAVRQADRAEQLRLGELEEAYVGAVEDDARRVHVAPADALLDAVLPGFVHAVY